MRRGSTTAFGYIYFVQAGEQGPIKVGFTGQQNPLERVSAVQTTSPEPVRVLGFVEGTPLLERALHRRFAAHRLRGEWFAPAPEILAYVAEFASVVPRKPQDAPVARPEREGGAPRLSMGQRIFLEGYVLGLAASRYVALDDADRAYCDGLPDGECLPFLLGRRPG